MFSTILKFLSSLIGSIGSIMGFFKEKNRENIIRKGYEEEKRADALEEDKKAKEIIDANNEKNEQIKEELDSIKNADLKDADKTDEDIKTELSAIEDEELRKKREMEIKAAKELKKRKQIRMDKLNNDDNFNNGDEITFEG